MIVREAKRQGVQCIVITHALTVPVRMSLDQIREASRARCLH